MPSLTVTGIGGRGASAQTPIAGVSFHVPAGRVAAIFGPPGCGGTALLRLIAGLDRASDGDVLIDDRTALAGGAPRRGVGLMFQHLALFSHLDVRGNIEFGLRAARWPARARAARVAALLQAVGLGEIGETGPRRVDELDGVQRRLVALARALAPEPRVLLLDEPLAGVDEPRRGALRALLRELLHRLDAAVVVATHDLRDATAFADALIVLDEGQVLQQGPLREVLAEPASAHVARLLGYVTLARGPVADRRVIDADAGAVSLPAGVALGGRAEVLAHPASLLAVPAGFGLGCGVEGRVSGSRPEGPAQLVDVDLGGRVLPELRWEWDLAPPPTGARVALAARPGTLRCYALPDDWEPVGHGGALDAGDVTGQGAPEPPAAGAVARA